jgi:hypothetical protein
VKRVVLVLCGFLAACGAAPPHKVTPPSSAPPPKQEEVDVEEPTEPAFDPSSGADFRTPVGIAGCTTENLAELRTRLETFEKRLRSSKETDKPATLVADVREAWQHPCLSHFARVFQAPPPSTAQPRFVELWTRGVGAALRSMAGAVYKRNGKNYIIAPPEELAPVSAKDRAALAQWLCRDPTIACSPAGSYVERAHDAFDQDEELAHRWNGMLVGGEGHDRLPNSFLATRLGCDEYKQNDAEKAAETPFETFEKCVASSSPRTWRYPHATTMRSRDQGWLVLRGRRGHYEFSDELGIFDLATGAAYFARSSSALVLSGVGVDFDAVDKQRKPQILAGNVAADQVREIAFLLATAPLLRSQRSNAEIVPLPEKLEVTLSKNHDAKHPFEVGEMGWSTSAQTQIAWQLVDGTTTIAKGDLTWPSSSRAWETHAAQLVRVMEAGFVEGCTRARLPTGITRGPAGAVHPIDADPKAQADVFTTLGKQLEALVHQPCH